MYPIGEQMTADQFLALPEETSRLRYELAHGVVVECPRRDFDHGYTLVALMTELGSHIHDRCLGQLFGGVDTFFGPEDVRAPDLLFFVNDRLGEIGDKYVLAPPDLCIEIISPENPGHDREDKFELYESSGVAYYWIVDPLQRNIEALRLESGKYISAGGGKDLDVVKLPPFQDCPLELRRLWRKYD
jgi:Uma2 family endonuclease